MAVPWRSLLSPLTRRVRWRPLSPRLGRSGSVGRRTFGGEPAARSKVFCQAEVLEMIHLMDVFKAQPKALLGRARSGDPALQTAHVDSSSGSRPPSRWGHN